ncbi:hypothetical protein [Candidatus Borrarchaeum sp.]|uniref:hypothetical protein n=1 Tax=Candidatus Borrarchaeum sp. TaxID=2846742 RepID=UPI00257DD8A7|nr:hypothetical protein [Candidatus Borrarchaeum sp.]
MKRSLLEIVKILFDTLDENGSNPFIRTKEIVEKTGISHRSLKPLVELIQFIQEQKTLKFIQQSPRVTLYFLE